MHRTATRFRAGKQRSLSSLKDSKLCEFPPCPILQRQVIFGWQRRRVEAAARRFTSYGREARGDRFIAVALRWREIHPSFVPDYASALRWSFGGSLQPQRFRLLFLPILFSDTNLRNLFFKAN